MTLERPLPIPAVQELLAACDADDHARIVSVIDQHPLDVWFGLGPDRIRSVLHGLPEDAATQHAVVGLFRRLHGDGLPHVPTALPRRGPAGLAQQAAYIIGIRWRGCPATAAQLLEKWQPERTARASAFLRSPGGAAFFALQRGITYMLAGRFGPALAAFADAVRHRPQEWLWVMTRDAYVKSAIVHALFGDPRLARIQLGLAERLPESDSWLEPHLDAQAEIAAALVDDDDADRTVDRLESVPPSLIGEMWPFWLEALYRAYRRAGRGEEGLRRVSALSAASPLEPGADGYPAAVMPVIRAMHLLTQGRPADANRELAELGDEQIMAVLARAFVAIALDDLDAAIRLLVAEQPRTAGLARMDASRRVILAWALLRRGETDAATDHLRTVQEQWRQTPIASLLVMPKEMDDFAARTLDGWTPHPISIQTPHRAPVPHFSPRERDVLRLMATDRSREQIAADLFVSVNTVKTQMSSIYRKLGVSSRVDALLAAHDLDIL